MKKLLAIFIIILMTTGGWYIAWKSMMADDVARIETTMQHHAKTIKATTPSANFKVDGIFATGFPFSFRVAVHRPTLTQVWGGESYALSFEQVELQRIDDTRYRVIAPAQFDALYAKDGSAPEKYSIALNEVPRLALLGKAEGPLIRYEGQLPKQLMLDVALNGQTKQIGFDFMLPLPVSADIPADATRPLQVFVGMLREAMVFQ